MPFGDKEHCHVTVPQLLFEETTGGMSRASSAGSARKGRKIKTCKSPHAKKKNAPETVKKDDIEIDSEGFEDTAASPQQKRPKDNELFDAL